MIGTLELHSGYWFGFYCIRQTQEHQSLVLNQSQMRSGTPRVIKFSMYFLRCFRIILFGERIISTENTNLTNFGCTQIKFKYLKTERYVGPIIRRRFSFCPRRHQGFRHHIHFIWTIGFFLVFWFVDFHFDSDDVVVLHGDGQLFLYVNLQLSFSL